MATARCGSKETPKDDLQTHPAHRPVLAGKATRSSRWAAKVRGWRRSRLTALATAACLALSLPLSFATQITAVTPASADLAPRYFWTAAHTGTCLYDGGPGQLHACRDRTHAAVASLASVIGEMTRQITVLEQQLAADFEQHPDAEVVRSLPGLGTILGARVLGEFGDAPNRYSTPRLAGTTPEPHPLPEPRAPDAWSWPGTCATSGSPTRSTCGRSPRSPSAPEPASSTTTGALLATPTTRPCADSETTSSASSTAAWPATRPTTSTPPGPTVPDPTSQRRLALSKPWSNRRPVPVLDRNRKVAPRLLTTGSPRKPPGVTTDPGIGCGQTALSVVARNISVSYRVVLFANVGHGQSAGGPVTVAARPPAAGDRSDRLDPSRR